MIGVGIKIKLFRVTFDLPSAANLKAGDGLQHAYKAALPLSRRAMWAQSLNAVLWSHDVRSGETKPTYLSAFYKHAWLRLGGRERVCLEHVTRMFISLNLGLNKEETVSLIGPCILKLKAEP